MNECVGLGGHMPHVAGSSSSSSLGSAGHFSAQLFVIVGGERAALRMKNRENIYPSASAIRDLCAIPATISLRSVWRS